VGDGAAARNGVPVVVCRCFVVPEEEVAEFHCIIVPLVLNSCFTLDN
jgi:hypothetical protein